MYSDVKQNLNLNLNLNYGEHIFCNEKTQINGFIQNRHFEMKLICNGMVLCLKKIV